MSVSFELILGYFITGTIWGATNSFMEVGTKEISENTQKTKAKGGKKNMSRENELIEGIKMFLKCGFLIPFLLNQTASIYNNFLQAKSDLSIAQPIVNCITFFATFITARLIQRHTATKAGKPEEALSLFDAWFFLGSLLIMAGLYLCLTK